MKTRFLVLMIGLLLLPSFLPAQAWLPPASLQSDTSFGVFTNELDAAFSALESVSGPGFTQLKSNYLFGGLDNLQQIANTAAAGPFYFGYYSAGSMPWSLFSFLDHTSALGEATGSLAINLTQAVVVPSASGNTTYNWVQTQTQVTNTPRPFAGINNDFAQFLISFSGITTGLGFRLNLQNAALSTTNLTQTVTNNYNTAAAATIPTPVLDYTVTTVNTNLGGSTSTGEFIVPFFFKMGNISQYLAADISFSGTDNSTSQVVTTTKPTDPTGGATTFTDINNSTTDKTSTTDIGATFGVTLPGAKAGDAFGAGVAASLTLGGRTYSQVNTSQVQVYPGGAGAFTKGAATDSEVSRTFDTGIGWMAQANAGYALHFTPAPIIQLGFVPAVVVSYQATGPNSMRLTQVTVTKTDANANGVFTDAGDSTLTTTIAYTNAGPTGTAAVTSGSLTILGSLPMAIMIKPEGWIFGVTLGARPIAMITSTSTQTLSLSTTTTTVNAVVGAASTTNVTQSAPGATSSTTDTFYSFGIDHNFGLNLAFPGGIKFDVVLNGSNLLSLDAVIVQGIVPLP